jgi:hypothetical protein
MMRRQFKVGDVARTTNSRWPLLNHRLVQIVKVHQAPFPVREPYLIRRVDGDNWCFPSTTCQGFVYGPEVWCSAAYLLPIDDITDPVPAVDAEVAS